MMTTNIAMLFNFTMIIFGMWYKAGAPMRIINWWNYDEANLEILQQIELIPQDNLLYYAEEMSLDETGVNVACIFL
jgi:hypothetical protein